MTAVAAITTGLSLWANYENKKSVDRYADEANDFAEMSGEYARESAEMDILGGQMAMQSAQTDATFHTINSEIQAMEAMIESGQVLKEGERFRKKQKLLFLKNGVDLTGSPLLVLEETRVETQKQVEALEQRAKNIKRLGIAQAGAIRSEGRARLFQAEQIAGARIFEADTERKRVRYQGRAAKSQARTQMFNTNISGLFA